MIYKNVEIGRSQKICFGVMPLQVNCAFKMGRNVGSGVAQLVERLLPIPEVRGSIPDIGINLFILNIYLLSTVY